MEREFSGLENNRGGGSRGQPYCVTRARFASSFAGAKLATINAKAADASCVGVCLCLLFLFAAFNSAHAHQIKASVSVPQAQVVAQPVRFPVVEGNGIRFTHLPGTRGLSQVRVARIIQDDRGFLWFATQAGLNRYDGYRFKVFTHDPDRPDSLSGTYVYSLLKDRSGAIWVGTDQFLDRFEASTESFTHFHIERGDPIVTHISQDRAGMLWLATETGLYRLDPANGHVSRFGHDPNDPFSLSSDNIQSTGEDREGKFWVVTDAGLDAFDRGTGEVTLHVPLPEMTHGSLCSVACRSFYEDSDGTFWVIYGSGSGLAVFDRKTNRLTKYSLYEQQPSGMVSAGVNAILEDRHGTLWLGTMGWGLLKFDRAHRRFIRYRRDPKDPDSLAENRVISLFEDRQANIWAGFHAMAPDFYAETQSPFEPFRLTSIDPDSEGENLVNAIYEDREGTLWMGADGSLIGLDRKTGRFTRYHPEGRGTSTEVLAVLEDRSGAMWVGTLGNGLSRLDRRTGQFKAYRRQASDPFSISNDTITRLFLDRAGTMWVATWDGLNRFDPETGHFNVYKQNPNSTEPYFSIMQDRNECLWLGSKSGLVRFCPKSGQFTMFQHDPGNPKSLSDNSLDSAYQDSSGAIWLGTQNGLNKLDPETNTFISYHEKDGLAGNAVSCILGDDQGNLWMSTNNGLSRFDPSTRIFKNYSVADGLPGNDLTGWDACFKSRSGEMFFGGFAGAVAFRPSSILDTSYSPPVVFTDFRLSGRPVKIGAGSPLRRSITYADHLTLSHQQDSFSVEFAALSFRSPGRNRYRYKLEGLDSEWHEVGSEERVVSYTTLPAGAYVLRVQGRTGRGSWSEPSTDLQITILPPWWATWWFRTACVVAFFALLWGIYQLRVHEVQREFNIGFEARLNERTRIARELHDTLLQNFHGLLFQFQAARNLMPRRTDDAMQHLDDAIDEAKKALAESRDAIQGLRSEPVTKGNLAELLTSASRELAGTASNGDSPLFHLIEEGERQRLSSTVNTDIFRIALELMRNAYQHAHAKRIEAEIRYGDNMLRLRIRDDGQGIDPKVLKDGGRFGHWGLRGIRERADRIGAHLDVWSDPGDGTEVQLLVPAEIAYESYRDSYRAKLLRKVKSRA
jgi:ligand-binding sensor domain-containing protein/signal transduction histidine kinase